MKLCLWPWGGKVDKGRYGEVVEQTKVFLKGERKDIIRFYRDAQFVEFVVLFSRGGAIIDMVEYPFNNATWEDEEIVREFIGQLYGGERFIPQEIIIPLRFEGVEALREWLSEKRGKKIRITV